MRKYSLLGSFLLTISILVMCSPVLAHNYFAPYMYLSGIYSPTGKPISYPPASDAEMNWLLQQIKDKDANVRVIAAGALGQTNNPKCVKPLLIAIGDNNNGVKMNAEMAFFNVKDSRAILPLKKALSEDNEDMAIYSLAAQGDKGIDAIMGVLSSNRGDLEAYYIEIADALMLARGAESFKWATDALSKPDKKHHPVAILVLRDLYLGDMKDAVSKAIDNSKITDLLVSAAKVKDSMYVGDAARELLSDSKDPRAKALRADEEAVRDEDTAAESSNPLKLTDKQIKQYAAHIRKARGKVDDYANLDANQEAEWMANTSNPAGVSTLIEILNEKNAAAARIAAQALAFSRNQKAIAALMQVLENTKHPAYKQAVDSLVHSGDLAAQIRLLQSQDSYAVQAAIDGIDISADPSVVKHLIPLLKNPTFRLSAAIVLAEHKDPAALDTLVDLLKDQETPGDKQMLDVADALFNYGQLAVNKLLPKLTDSDPKVRSGAASYFIGTKEPRTVDPLIALLSDTNVRVRRHAIQALLFQNDSKAVPSYTTALKDSDPEVKKHACTAVALFPTPSAVDTLSSLLNDKDQHIRTCAAIALGELGDKRGADVIVRFLTSILTSAEEDEYNEDCRFLATPAIRAAGKIKEKRVVDFIMNTLNGDVIISTFDGVTDEEITASREAKLEALRSITGQNFDYAFYRWMAWWVAQGNKPVILFSDR